MDPGAGAGASGGGTGSSGGACGGGRGRGTASSSCSSTARGAAGAEMDACASEPRRWAQVLFVLGCLAAALALFSINSDTADSRRLLGACAPTDAEAAALRVASEKLVVAAAAQILAATTAVLVPAPLFAVVGTLLGSMTGYLTGHLLWMLVACHARHDLVLAIFYWIFVAMLCVAYLVGCIISVCLSDSE